ncbi:hypothetical protein NEMIN01_0881 [Nematocida minor]|uniref:uncharacterized protein n=1 Tax=Nematocida minor TaxID=1912983 RepID=UPI00221F288F|nr:uncharacterized protein NEMIN01_0881 [Nematocida minor]KAI5190096.1 hypothetical protein NEMIN01_0881 [Nematocida minor]
MPVKTQIEERKKPIVSLRAPPTAMQLHNSKLTIAHKSGEIVTIDTETKERKVLAKEKVSVTAVCQTQDILLVGTRKGEVKSLINKSLKRISKRHRSLIVSIDAIETETGEVEIITASADHRVHIWKLDITENKGKKVAHLLFLKTLYGPNTPITSSSLSQDKKLFLCTAELAETVRVFRLEKDTQLLFHLQKGEYALAALFIKNNQFVVVSSTNTVYLFSTDQSEPIQSLYLETENSSECAVSSLKLLSDSTFAVGLTNGHIFILDFSQSISVKDSMSVDAIPNDIVSTGSTLYIAGGKEEKHTRFFINKTASNGLFTNTC